MSAANDLRYGMTSWFIGFCDWYLRTFFATNSEKEKEEIRYTKNICKEILDDTKDIDGIELDFRIDGFYANGMIMGTRKQIVGHISKETMNLKVNEKVMEALRRANPGIDL